MNGTSNKQSCEEKQQDIYVISTDSSKHVPQKVSRWKCRIDREMVHFKLHYFLYIGGLSAGLPYIIVFAKDRIGITATSLGAVLIAQMFMFTFSKPILGYIADYFNKIRIIISILIILGCICNFLLLVIPSIESDEHQTNDSYYLPKNGGMLSVVFLNTVESSTVMENSSSYFYAQLPPSENYTICFISKKAVSFKNNILSNTNVSKCLETYTEHSSFRTFEICCDIIHEDLSPSKAINNVISEKQFINESVILYVSSSSLAINVSNEIHNYSLVSSICTSVKNKLCFGVQSYSQFESLDNSTSIERTRSDFVTYQFWVFAVLYTVSSICINAVFTLSDTACLETIQKSGSEFGKQRLWGAIGWGALAPISGFVNDFTGDYLASWIIMVAMLLLLVVNILKLNLVKPNFSQNILKDIKTVFKSKEFVIFQMTVFVNGLGSGVIWFYLIWFLTSIGGNKLVCGLSLTIQSFLGSLPFMFFSDWIIKRIGHYNVLSISLLGYAIRFLWYSYLHNPWLVLPVEWLHGVTYGLYYASLASYGKINSMPGTEATTQAVIFGTHEGLGGGIGCVLVGLGFDYIGTHRTFFYASVIAACGLCMSIIFTLISRKKHKDIEINQD